MFGLTIKKQGEKIFELEHEIEKLKKQLIDEKKKNEKNKNLLNYAKRIIEKSIIGLFAIQDINREGSTPEIKTQRINSIINQLEKELGQIKNELP